MHNNAYNMLSTYVQNSDPFAVVACNNLPQCHFILMNAFVCYNDKIYLHRLCHNYVVVCIEYNRADFYKAFFIIDRTRR